MSIKQLTYEDVREIIKLVEEADKFSEFRLRYDDIEISLSKNSRPADISTQTQASISKPESSAKPADVPESVRNESVRNVEVSAASKPVVQAEWPEHFVTVRAPMVGTFYCAPEPGAEPFVSVGDTIAAHDTVCIIEVMKLMNALAAESGGVVKKILVSDGETVEYGQPLIVIDPAS
jgi:acetyl-CoA carboxylase biotin carboxyl carrier protein